MGSGNITPFVLQFDARRLCMVSLISPTTHGVFKFRRCEHTCKSVPFWISPALAPGLLSHTMEAPSELVYFRSNAVQSISKLSSFAA